jgi:hypothetical protein
VDVLPASAGEQNDLLAQGRTLLAAGDAPGAESVARRLIGLDPYAAPSHAEAVVFGRAEADAAADIIRAAVAEARTTIADARRTAEA